VFIVVLRLLYLRVDSFVCSLMAWPFFCRIGFFLSWLLYCKLCMGFYNHYPPRSLWVFIPTSPHFYCLLINIGSLYCQKNILYRWCVSFKVELSTVSLYKYCRGVCSVTSIKMDYQVFFSSFFSSNVVSCFVLRLSCLESCPVKRASCLLWGTVRASSLLEFDLKSRPEWI